MIKGNVSIIPYIQVDGIPLFRDSQILELIDRSERDGTLPMVFYGNSEIYTKYDFLERVKEGSNCMLFVIKYRKDTAAFVFLDHIGHRHAFGHFCIYKEYWGTEEMNEIAKTAIRFLHETYSVLYGIIPVENDHAIRFSEKTLGMKRLTTVPKYFYNNDTRKDIDGIMLYTAREE